VFTVFIQNTNTVRITFNTHSIKSHFIECTTKLLCTKPSLSSRKVSERSVIVYMHYLQLHPIEIPAQTSGGQKKTTGCSFNCPCVGIALLQREKKQVVLWWKRPISFIQNSHNRCDFQSLSRPFVNDGVLSFNISYANGVSGKKLLDIPTALTHPARADNTRFSRVRCSLSLVPSRGIWYPTTHTRRSHRGPSRYVDIKGNSTATRNVSLTHWHGHSAYVDTFSLFLRSSEIPLFFLSIFLWSVRLFSVDYIHLFLSWCCWSHLLSDRLFGGRSGWLFFLSAMEFRFTVRFATIS